MYSHVLVKVNVGLTGQLLQLYISCSTHEHLPKKETQENNNKSRRKENLKKFEQGGWAVFESLIV